MILMAYVMALLLQEAVLLVALLAALLVVEVKPVNPVSLILLPTEVNAVIQLGMNME